MKHPFSIVCSHLVLVIAMMPASALAATQDPIEGFTEPYHDVDVASSEMGVITKVFVVEGDRVHAGQLLAQLDDSVLRATLEIVKCELSAEGRLRSAEAELELQTDLLDRLRGLLEQKHASMQEVARAASQKKVLAARVQTVNEELTVKSYEMRRIERQLDQRRIVAPIDGIVTRVPKQVGEFVSPGDPVSAKVVQLDPLLINFPVPLSLAHDLKRGTKVNVHVEGNGTHEGEVEFVSPTADGQSGTTRIRVKLANPGEQIACGVPSQLVIQPQSASELPKTTAGK
jgi:RND family efflux transporter MFP subunit